MIDPNTTPWSCCGRYACDCPSSYSELSKYKRAHAWFVKQGAPKIVHRPRFGEESVHCASCKSEINHLKDCEWVKAKELKL